jgi:branched-chain amino acid transport system permease protein
MSEAMGKAVYRFEPINLSRWLLWGLFALVLLVAPKVFTSSLSLTMLTQMGTAIIVCLSYNMLLGQGGMLSFGHAVYSGLGAFAAIHTLNKVAEGAWGIPVSLVPLVGGRARGRHHAQVGHHLRDDHAGCGRAGVVDVLDAAGVLRR